VEILVTGVLLRLQLVQVPVVVLLKLFKALLYMDQMVEVVLQLPAQTEIVEAINQEVEQVAAGLQEAALLRTVVEQVVLEDLCFKLQRRQLLEVVQVEIQPAHQTVLLALAHLLILSVVLEVVAVQAAALLLAMVAQAAIPVVVVVAAVLATQLTQVLVAMVATVTSVL
jgi:hypothetical protein